jgi:hypothetical protein
VHRLRQRLTYANVVSSLALFLVLTGGAAYAAKKIGSHQLRGGAVTTAKIKRNAVTTSKIANGAVKTSKIAPGNVTSGKLATGSITAEKLAPGFVAPAAERLSRAANVSSAGTVLLGSTGIAQVNITHPTVGFYCFSGFTPAPVGGLATIDYSESGQNIAIQFDTGQGPEKNCPVGTQAFVNTRALIVKSGVVESIPTDAGFYVALY